MTAEAAFPDLGQKLHSAVSVPPRRHTHFACGQELVVVAAAAMVVVVVVCVCVYVCVRTRTHDRSVTRAYS